VEGKKDPLPHLRQRNETKMAGKTKNKKLGKNQN